MTTSRQRKNPTANIGILAHIDAGKTSVTERLLYAAGIIDHLGSVDGGDTQTDTMELERRRGITIKSAVVSFSIGDLPVNLVDTPGHPDFIAEVERVLDILDGVVLVVSAVEGVQAQTQVLMRTLTRLGIPTILFVNKVDRRGADPVGVVRAIKARLTPDVIALGAVADAGTRGAAFAPFAFDNETFADELTEILTSKDESLLGEYIDKGRLSPDRLRKALIDQTREGLVHPILFGSAVTGEGIDQLSDAIYDCAFRTAKNGGSSRTAEPAGVLSESLHAKVFKVERGRMGEKIAYVRMYSGRLGPRDRISFFREDEEHTGKVTAVRVFEKGASTTEMLAQEGQIAKVWGLPEIRIGDQLGRYQPNENRTHFRRPSLVAVVYPKQLKRRVAMHTALQQLAEQDPLINVQASRGLAGAEPLRGQQEISVHLYGEVQKEVIAHTLETDYGVEVEFEETKPLCAERLVSWGEGKEDFSPENPWAAGVGLRIEPGPIDSGFEYVLAPGIGTGSLPLAFHRAIEATVKDVLQQGIFGWDVIDCRVTITFTSYDSVASTAGDFRKLTPLVLSEALKKARTKVCEPIRQLRLEIPADTLSAMLSLLARLRAKSTPTAIGETVSVIEGVIPAATVHQLDLLLPDLTRGEGALHTEFAGYQPISGEAPIRTRWDDNPFDRKEYLLHILGAQ